MTNLNLRFDVELIARADAAMDAESAAHDRYAAVRRRMWPGGVFAEDADAQLKAEYKDAKAADLAARQATLATAQTAIDDIMANADEDVRDALAQYMDVLEANPVGRLWALRELNNAYIMTLKEYRDARKMYLGLKAGAADDGLTELSPGTVHRLNAPDAYIVDAGNLDIEGRVLRPLEAI